MLFKPKLDSGSELTVLVRVVDVEVLLVTLPELIELEEVFVVLSVIELLVLVLDVFEIFIFIACTGQANNITNKHVINNILIFLAIFELSS